MTHGSITSSGHQIELERQELLEIPKEEEELVLIYRSKGPSDDQACSLAARLMADRNNSLDTLFGEELGIDPEELGRTPLSAFLPLAYLSRI